MKSLILDALLFFGLGLFNQYFAKNAKGLWIL